eukprot:403375519
MSHISPRGQQSSSFMNRLNKTQFQEDEVQPLNSPWYYGHIQNPIFETKVISHHSQMQSANENRYHPQTHHAQQNQPGQSPYFNQKIFSTQRQAHHQPSSEQLNYRDINPMFYVSREQHPHSLHHQISGIGIVDSQGIVSGTHQNLSENMPQNLNVKYQDILSEDDDALQSCTDIVRNRKRLRLSIDEKSTELRGIYPQTDQDLIPTYTGMSQLIIDDRINAGQAVQNLNQDINHSLETAEFGKDDSNKRKSKQKRKVCEEKRGLLVHYIRNLSDEQLVFNTLSGFLINMKKSVKSCLTANGLFELVNKKGKLVKSGDSDTSENKYWKVKQKEAQDYIAQEKIKFSNMKKKLSNRQRTFKIKDSQIMRQSISCLQAVQDKKKNKLSQELMTHHSQNQLMAYHPNMNNNPFQQKIGTGFGHDLIIQNQQSYITDTLEGLNLSQLRQKRREMIGQLDDFHDKNEKLISLQQDLNLTDPNLPQPEAIFKDLLKQIQNSNETGYNMDVNQGITNKEQFKGFMEVYAYFRPLIYNYMKTEEYLESSEEDIKEEEYVKIEEQNDSLNEDQSSIIQESYSDQEEEKQQDK